MSCEGHKDLMSLTPAEFNGFLNSFDHVFSDCDGVVWSSGSPLPGVGDFFKLMKNNGKTVHFVSNNSLRTKEDYDALFKAADIEDGVNKLTIPSLAIVEYLKSVNFTKKVYCVSCDETIKVLESNGFECKHGPEVCADFYEDYIQYLDDDEEIGAVVFDSDFKVNLPKLYKAITYLQREDVIFINGATDKLVPLKPGILSLGTGAFSDLVKYETARTPIQLGKPGQIFGELAMKRAGVTDPSRVLFIGDMIEQDIGLGRAVGFTTLLVMTNTTKEDMLKSKIIRPDYYAPSLGSIVPLLQRV